MELKERDPARRLPFYHVTSFAHGAHLHGNPAGVVFVTGTPLSNEAMLCAAFELGLSETGFVRLLDAIDDFTTASRFELRWFSPKREVALCGHGTLAASHALFAHARNAHTTITFETLSGPLVVTREEGGCAASAAHAPPASFVRMTFPANPPSPRDCTEPLIAALIAELLAGCGSSDDDAVLPPLRVISAHYSARARKLLLVCNPGSARAISALRPDVSALLRINQELLLGTDGGGGRVEGITLTARASEGGDAAGEETAATPPPHHHFVQRYWSPWNLAGEDPVNGSSHTLLAPYWAKELGCGRVGEALVSLALSPRGGVLHVAVVDGGAAVSIAGEARTWVDGSMWV